MLARKKEGNSRQGEQCMQRLRGQAALERSRVCWSSELGLGGVEAATDGKGQRKQSLENRLRRQEVILQDRGRHLKLAIGAGEMAQ